MILLAVGVVMAVLVGIVLMMGVGIYNRLVELRNTFKQSFSNIDVQLKRRHDLIPNLVETAKGYLKHERETLEAVIAARGAAVSAREKVAADPGNPEAMKALGSAESGLGGTLGRLMMLSESYPDLKADRSMNELSAELTQTENQVAGARQSFNHDVTAYNTCRERFPNVLIAGMLGFHPAAMFEITDPQERVAPKVRF